MHVVATRYPIGLWVAGPSRYMMCAPYNALPNMSQLAIENEESKPETAHRFGPIVYHGVEWDLSHLDSFAFKIDPG